MKLILAILTLTFLGACTNLNPSQQKKDSKETKQGLSTETKHCDYIQDFADVGNRMIDTIRIGKRLIDPIDDFSNFKDTTFGFVTAKDKLYKKAKTHRDCDGEFIDVEYYQEFTNRIELESYKAYNDRFFTTKNKVNFWWVNSDGHLIIPINGADPMTFEPFENICGGKDKHGIYYGCPNYGVYQLDILQSTTFKFVAKKNNYWNTPNHYLIIGNKVYDIKYEHPKGYFCELDETISIKEALTLKK